MSARVHRAFLVRPLMQYQVRFHLHFLTLKQSNSVYFFMVLAGSIYFPARSQQFILWVRLYLTIIPLALVGYEMIIANSALRASLAIYHLISNKREWNNCFIKNAPKI